MKIEASSQLLMTTHNYVFDTLINPTTANLAIDIHRSCTPTFQESVSLTIFHLSVDNMFRSDI